MTELKIGKTQKFGNIEIIDENNVVVAVIGSTQETIKETHDRALLMVSASDLLEACEEVTQWIGAAFPDNEMPCFAKLKEAIKKAKGE